MKHCKIAYSKVLRLSFGLMLVVLCACGNTEQDESATRKQDVPVITAQVQKMDFREIASGIGSLVSPKVVEIAPEIPAILREVHVHEGQHVSRGDLLFTLDADTLRKEMHAVEAELSSARAELENESTTFERFQRLYSSRTISRDEYDTRATALRTAKAEVARLESRVALMQTRLGDTAIRAPMDGVIDAHQADPGDYVDTGETLTTLYRLDPLEVDFNISEDYMGRVRSGLHVDVVLSGRDMPAHAGKVFFVSPRVAEATRKFLVKAEVENKDGSLKPGAFASVKLVLDVREGRPAIPESALVSQRGGYVVFVVKDGKAEMRDVKTGLREPGMVEILQGVEPGEQVVVEGQMRLQDGAAVSVREEAGSPASSGEQRREEGASAQ